MRSETHIKTLVEQLAEDNYDAFCQLQQFGRPVIPYLLPLLAGRREGNITDFVISLLMDFSEQQDLNELIQFVPEKTELVFKSLLPDSAEWLIEQVIGGSPFRINALKLLNGLNVQHLGCWIAVEAALSDSDIMVRSTALELISKAPDDDRSSTKWKLVEIALKDRSDFIREQAVYTLAEFPENENELLACLKDSSWRVRARAADFICRLSTKSATDGLVEAFLAEPNERKPGILIYQSEDPKSFILGCLIKIRTPYSTDQLGRLIPLLPTDGYGMLVDVCYSLADRECEFLTQNPDVSGDEADHRLDPRIIHSLARVLKSGDTGEKRTALQFCVKRKCTATAILIVLAFRFSSETEALEVADAIDKRFEDIAPFSLRELAWYARRGGLSYSHGALIALRILRENCSEHRKDDEIYVICIYLLDKYRLLDREVKLLVRKDIERLSNALASRNCPSCRGVADGLSQILID